MANGWSMIGQSLANGWPIVGAMQSMTRVASNGIRWLMVGRWLANLCVFLLFLYRFLFFLGLNGVLLEMIWLIDVQWMVNRWPVADRLLANEWPLVRQWLATSSGWPMVGQWFIDG